MNEELQQKVDRAIKLIQSAGKIAKMHGQPLDIGLTGFGTGRLTGFGTGRLTGFGTGRISG